jgi:hypothetical protein
MNTTQEAAQKLYNLVSGSGATQRNRSIQELFDLKADGINTRPLPLCPVNSKSMDDFGYFLIGADVFAALESRGLIEFSLYEINPIADSDGCHKVSAWKTELPEFGITRVSDGRIRTNGGEIHAPASLLWFPLPMDVDVLHLPGSEDGDPEFWTEAEFRDYCRCMAE